MEKTCENCKYYDMPTTSGICFECLHIPAVCTLWEQKPITNYDRVIRKTPEELAEWLSCNCTGDGYGNSAEDWLDWLRQEAEP